MKRFLTLLVTFVVAVIAYADNEVTVKSGSLAVFSLPEKTQFEIDYSQAKVNGTTLEEYLKGRGDDFVKDWPGNAEYARRYFVERFNKKNKKGLQITDNDDTKWKIVFQISKLDMGNGGSSFIPFAGAKAGGIIVSGLMEVINTETNKSVCCIDVDEVKGLGHVSETVRLGLCYFEVVGKAFKLAKKADPDEPLTESPRLTGSAKTKAAKAAAATTTAAATTATAAKSTAATATKAVASTGKKAAGKGKTAAKGKTTAKGKTAATKTTAAPPAEPEVKAQPVAEEEAPAEVERKGIPQCVRNAKGEAIPRRRKPVLGSFDKIAKQSRIGVYIDFTDADIDGRSEKEFIRHMRSGVDKDERDPNFANTWEQDLKPDYVSMVVSEANKKLKKSDTRMRLSSETDTKYILKMEILTIDDDGNNKINFLFVNTETCEVEAQITLENKGGHFGEYVGLLKQGFESASENFADYLSDVID